MHTRVCARANTHKLKHIHNSHTPMHSHIVTDMFVQHGVQTLKSIVCVRLRVWLCVLTCVNMYACIQTRSSLLCSVCVAYVCTCRYMCVYVFVRGVCLFITHGNIHTHTPANICIYKHRARTQSKATIISRAYMHTCSHTYAHPKTHARAHTHAHEHARGKYNEDHTHNMHRVQKTRLRANRAIVKNLLMWCAFFGLSGQALV